MGRRDFHKMVIGRCETLDFVDFDLAGIPAKTDTGAYRSSVHADDIHHDESTGTLSFSLLGGHPQFGGLSKRIETRDFSKVWVESSTGHGEDRYEVKLKIKLGPKVFIASFSLANRAGRVYPVLLGRKMMSNRFLVDTSLCNVDRADLKERYGIELPQDEEGEYENSDSVQG